MASLIVALLYELTEKNIANPKILALGYPNGVGNSELKQTSHGTGCREYLSLAAKERNLVYIADGENPLYLAS